MNNTAEARKTTIIQFGSVLWITAPCPNCGKREDRNVHQGEDRRYRFTCCREILFVPNGNKVTEQRVAKGKNGFRRKPSGPAQKRILNGQCDRCLYCMRRFGSVVWERGYTLGKASTVRLRLVWDHYVPYIYSLDSSDANFVAACHICNGFKADLMMDSVVEYQTHIGKKCSRRYFDTEDEALCS